MNAIIVSAILGVVLMFSSWMVSSKTTQKNIALVGLFVLFIANLAQMRGWYVMSVDTKGMLAFTEYGLFVNTLIYFLSFLYVWINADEVAAIGDHAADFYALFFFILCGVAVLTSFQNLLMLFIGIEIVSIPLYILTGSDKKNLLSNEASLKYFLMGSFSTGVLLLGITLYYGANGTFSLINPDIILSKNNHSNERFLLSAGLILLFAAMNFKVSSAPFHFWTPDVYDGAPTVFTSFMASIVKSTIFIAFASIFQLQSKNLGTSWSLLFNFVVFATLFFGNITAIFQRSVKRMMAYSSIAQAGFMLFAVYNVTAYATEGLLLYITVYSLASIGVFAVLIKMKDYSFEAFNGLAKQDPLLAFLMAVFLLSLAGIPLTGGFFAKFYMLNAAYTGGVSIAMIVIAILFAAISVYYYFKIIQAMYFAEGTPSIKELPVGYKSKLIILAALIVLLGVIPTYLFNYLYF